ncbi:hypothetical protein K9N68_11260 [Kovacikia minuta CCNUW1]|uniref:hypothetical protein n=1 Tax=Kovacikia minuta TaxID=2931930 RepID=UPI001CCF2B12|nr:hypothetical protein [Kovacikia minuta]UBF28396.1 hypothetical protein K9N68_11260 [Kovacikia minuta CCNUW1]
MQTIETNELFNEISTEESAQINGGYRHHCWRWRHHWRHHYRPCYGYGYGRRYAYGYGYGYR